MVCTSFMNARRAREGDRIQLIMIIILVCSSGNPTVLLQKTVILCCIVYFYGAFVSFLNLESFSSHSLQSHGKENEKQSSKRLFLCSVEEKSHIVLEQNEGDRILSEIFLQVINLELWQKTSSRRYLITFSRTDSLQLNICCVYLKNEQYYQSKTSHLWST